MYDDTGDIDHNGIPDSIQLDPVAVPEAPFVFGEPVADAGLPGIDSPIEATADPLIDAVPMPVEPTPPPVDADPATFMRYEQDLQKYNLMFEMYSKIMANSHEMKKSIIDNLRG